MCGCIQTIAPADLDIAGALAKSVQVLRAVKKVRLSTFCRFPEFESTRGADFTYLTAWNSLQYGRDIVLLNVYECVKFSGQK